MRCIVNATVPRCVWLVWHDVHFILHLWLHAKAAVAEWPMRCCAKSSQNSCIALSSRFQARELFDLFPSEHTLLSGAAGALGIERRGVKENGFLRKICCLRG
jgi:hypothetical protein